MDDPCRVSDCPIFCILKAVLFALIAVFVLYFPLGDPYEICSPTNKSHSQNLPVVCLCDAYIKTVKLFNKTKEVMKLLVCRAMDLLYEAKLKFYALLHKIDSGDLYQSVCCTDCESNQGNEQKRPPCKCTRKCCRKNTA